MSTRESYTLKRTGFAGLVILFGLLALFWNSSEVSSQEGVSANGGFPIDAGEPLSYLFPEVETLLDADGNLLYFFNSQRLGKCAGRFNTATRQWELWTAEGWLNTPDALGDSLSYGAFIDAKLKLFLRDDGIIEGMVVSRGLSGRLRIDVHGHPDHILFDGIEWKRWKGGAAADSSLFRGVISSWAGVSYGYSRVDYALNEDSGVGIMVGKSGLSRPYYVGSLTAARYDASQNSWWKSWGVVSTEDPVEFGWVNHTSSHHYLVNPYPDIPWRLRNLAFDGMSQAEQDLLDANYTFHPETGLFHLNDYVTVTDRNSLIAFFLRLNRASEEHFWNPRVAWIRGTNQFLIPWIYSSDGNNYILTAYRYSDVTGTWEYWDGQGWAAGPNGEGEFVYGELPSNLGRGRYYVVLSPEDDKVSIFMVSDGALQELTYDQSGRVFEPPEKVAVNELVLNKRSQGGFGRFSEIFHRPLFIWELEMIATLQPPAADLNKPFHVMMDSDGTIWLTFTDDTINVYLMRRPAGSDQWEDLGMIYSCGEGSGAQVRPAGFHVLNDGAWAAFLVIEESDGIQRLMAVTSEDLGDTPIQRTGFQSQPPMDETRFSWQDTWDNGDASRNISVGAHMTVDYHGVVYEPQIQVHYTITWPVDGIGPHVLGGGTWFLCFPSGVAVDPIQNLLFLAYRGYAGGGYGWASGMLAVFDGSEFAYWQEDWPADPVYNPYTFTSGFQRISDVAVYSLPKYTERRLFAADTLNNRIQVFDIQGVPDSFPPPKLFDIPQDTEPALNLNFPQGIAVSELGFLYVVDARNHRIVKLNLDGGYVTSWGSKGQGPGEFFYPYGIEVDPVRQVVYVTEPYNRRFQVFSPDGGFITQGSSFYNGTSTVELEMIHGIAVDELGHLFMTNKADVNRGKVNKFEILDTSPQVEVTAPPAATTVYVGEPVSIAFHATDDWGLLRAELWVEGASEFEDSAEYAYSRDVEETLTWTPYRPGTFFLFVKTIDSSSQETLSEVTEITVIYQTGQLLKAEPANP